MLQPNCAKTIVVSKHTPVVEMYIKVTDLGGTVLLRFIVLKKLVVPVIPFSRMLPSVGNTCTAPNIL